MHECLIADMQVHAIEYTRPLPWLCDLLRPLQRNPCMASGIPLIRFLAQFIKS